MVATTRARRVLAVLVATNFALAVVALSLRATGDTPSVVAVPASATVAVSAPPVLVEIGAVQIAADVVPVGLNEQRAIVVPPLGRVGWYPGEGAIVLVGHVDSQSGPDVFFGLHKLAGGEQVVVTARDGTRTTYVVREKRLVPKAELPAEIFDPRAGPGLWLITCGGAFDHKAHSYESNQLVYAAPI